MSKDKYCKCGHKLIKRNGKYGEFYGCSDFPKCRYTENIKKANKDVDLFNSLSDRGYNAYAIINNDIGHFMEHYADYDDDFRFDY